MHSVIDPSADVVWLSVQTQWTDEGTVEIRPQTDEEWASVRRGAIVLLESANLLMIPGRPVAHPGEVIPTFPADAPAPGQSSD